MSSLLDAAHDVVRRVFEGSDGLDIVPRARLVAAGRDGKLKRLMRSLVVVVVRCLGWDRHQTVALDVVRRPKTTPILNWSATCAARIAHW